MLIFLTAVEGAFAVKSTTDDALIERIAKGDMDAFRMLYENVSGSIYGFVLSIVKNAYVAEDVLQDTFLQFLRTSSITAFGSCPSSNSTIIFSVSRRFFIMPRSIRSTDSVLM